MKKSSIFKILTLFITFVIFSCCSGCFLSFVAYTNERKLQELLEIERQRKEQADALIPEVEGYTFEARPTSYFSSREDWESQGFLTYADFVDKNKGSEYNFTFTNLEDGSIKISIRHFLGKGGNYIIISPEQEEKYGGLFSGGYGYLVYNEKSFIFREMNGVEHRSVPNPRGIGLFLIDFEKHEMYYVCYSKGWIEAELNDNRIYDLTNICLKLTKNEGEII